MNRKDVTREVIFGEMLHDYPDEGGIPIYECVCGRAYNDFNDRLVLYDNETKKCRECGIILTYEQGIKIVAIEH